jgi:hypothetical protein
VDPHTHTAPVTVQITGTSALLLARLAEVSSSAGPLADGQGGPAPSDLGAVLMRALGLLDLALKAKREGKRLAFYDPERDELSEVAF